jgi:hypothetical protein
MQKYKTTAAEGCYSEDENIIGRFHDAAVPPSSFGFLHRRGACAYFLVLCDHLAWDSGRRRYGPAKQSGTVRENTMTNQDTKQQGANQQGGGNQSGPGSAADGNQQKANDQGGHAGMHGHGGQHSGGMGGEHGGNLHDVGSGQSGMAGPGSLGGHEPATLQPGSQSGPVTDIPGGEEGPLAMGDDEIAEVQQSAQREGMGHHDHRRRQKQAIDATSDVDKLGSQNSGAANSSEDS